MVSTLLNSHFLLFLSLAQTRDRRPLQNGERQSGYRSVSFSAFSAFHRQLTATHMVKSTQGAAQGELPEG